MALYRLRQRLRRGHVCTCREQVCEFVLTTRRQTIGRGVAAAAALFRESVERMDRP